MTTYADMVSETGEVNASAIMRLAHMKARARWEGETYAEGLARALRELWAMVRVTVDCRKGAMAVRALPVAERMERHHALTAYILENRLSN